MKSIEIVAALKHLEKVDPPKMAYRYRRPGEYTIKEIGEPHLYLASASEMNDPFELQAAIDFDKQQVKNKFFAYCREQGMTKEQVAREVEKVGNSHIEGLQRGVKEGVIKESAIICLSSEPRSVRMWAYYADSHKGVCITYDTTLPPFCYARPVLYENPSVPLDVMKALEEDSTLLADHVSYRKGSEWAFEKEYRIVTGAPPVGTSKALSIESEAIIEIRLGVNIEENFKEEVLVAASKLPVTPKIIQMKCNLENFKLVEEEFKLS